MEKKWGAVEDGIIFVHLSILQMTLINNIFITKHFIELQLKGTWPFSDLTDSTYYKSSLGIDFWLYQTLYLNLIGKMLSAF